VEKTTTETGYYLLSSELRPERFNEAVRRQWSIENRLHWRLDLVMNENQDQTRAGKGAHNRAVLCHMVINTMQKEGSKGSTRANTNGQAGTADSYSDSWRCSEMVCPGCSSRHSLKSQATPSEGEFQLRV
jgi:hypothetical protein